MIMVSLAAKVKFNTLYNITAVKETYQTVSSGNNLFREMIPRYPYPYHGEES